MEFDFTRIAERKIQEAIEEGKFDDLPGKGKPLNLDDDPFTPPHLRLANRILKNAGVLPDWMQVEQEMELTRQENERTFERLKKEYVKRRERVDSRTALGNPEKRKRDFAAWHARVRAGYLASLKRVNTDITKLSLIAPSVQRVHFPYNIAQEMERFDAEIPALPNVVVDAQPEDRRESVARQAAEARYRYGR
jgi:DnaJ family protein C protein 28